MTAAASMTPELRAVYASTIFLGAFPVFRVRPLPARTIRPWFGGTTAVWTTALWTDDRSDLLSILHQGR
jgi:hypothetical protein